MNATPPTASKRRNAPNRADLAAVVYRWYECPCGARVPVWGDALAPSHCSYVLEGVAPPVVGEAAAPPPEYVLPVPCVPIAGDGADVGYLPCACGSTFPGATGKRGAPRRHCSPECRELAAALAILSKHLHVVERRATPEAWLRMRAEIQGRFACRPWNRGVRRQLDANKSA